MDHAVKSPTTTMDKPLISNRTLTVCFAVLGLLLVFSLALFLGSDWIGRALTSDRRSESTTPRAITIGLDHLRIEDNTIRFQRQRHDGTLARVDLALTWPEMRGYSQADRLRFDDISQSNQLLFLQISQSTMSRDMSGRIEPIYKQLFEGAPQPGPFGLTGHRFRAGSGYDGEILYTAPRPGRPDFAIRCLSPDQAGLQQDGPTVDTCQRDLNAGHDLSVLYRFSRQKLADWRQIDSAVEEFVASRLTVSSE
ncbi:hypothetical protein ACQZ61_12840 [Agrobacterium vitis]|uniref:hypothetical protein n=1 Tax=Agrobacterium vitis TaxID=373 RepID=UPI0015DAFFFF|nr:hypothetical protein [Agrobacterium vitis]MCF1453257.1 hypothetical protein [Agrobacterium vitis]BCH54334.1 membrane protein [Agrobacterium vitis]